MLRVIAATLAALAIAGFALQARAAEIEIPRRLEMSQTVAIMAEAQPGDVLVARQANGGTADAAAVLALFLLDNPTIGVHVEGTCYSACSMLWLSAGHRTIEPEGRLGFHGPACPIGTGVYELCSRESQDRLANLYIAAAARLGSSLGFDLAGMGVFNRLAMTVITGETLARLYPELLP